MLAGPHFLSIVCHFKSFTTFKKGDSLLLMHSLFHVCLGGKPEEKQINQYIQWSRALIVFKRAIYKIREVDFCLTARRYRQCNSFISIFNAPE